MRPAGVEAGAVDTRVLCACVAIAGRCQRITTSRLMAVSGYRSTSTISRAMHRLRKQGFVDFVDGTAGTMRVLVEEIGLPIDRRVSV